MLYVNSSTGETVFIKEDGQQIPIDLENKAHLAMLKEYKEENNTEVPVRIYGKTA